MLPDPTRPEGAAGPVTSVNHVTHWWDGSSLYGSNLEQQQRVRTGHGGRLHLTEDRLLPMPDRAGPGPHPRARLVDRAWACCGTLFVREHNAVCARLQAEYPQWSDEELFQRARLVVAALLAKIHTAEWTPAVISHPTTVAALRANWFGVAGERIAEAFGRISDSEVISGIPGAATEHYGVPFCLTEEFTSVYRMHPLLPDDFDLRAVDDRRAARAARLPVAGRPALARGLRPVLDERPVLLLRDLPPRGDRAHNFPRFLQEFERPDGTLVDLAATDVLRTRELGVPRYNAFRRLMHLEPADSHSRRSSPTRRSRREVSELYDGDVEKVDLMVGLFAEERPAGFAFSDTAFRIFVLMASRRLNSDRFFTEDYRPEVYSPVGLAWVRDNDMRTVLLRHYPELTPALRGVDNAFAPWRRTSA